MVGNDSSPLLEMFREVSKRLSAEMSEIFVTGPKFRIVSSGSISYSKCQFSNFAHYHLSCLIQSRQSI